MCTQDRRRMKRKKKKIENGKKTKSNETTTAFANDGNKIGTGKRVWMKAKRRTRWNEELFLARASDRKRLSSEWRKWRRKENRLKNRMYLLLLLLFFRFYFFLRIVRYMCRSFWCRSPSCLHHSSSLLATLLCTMHGTAYGTYTVHTRDQFEYKENIQTYPAYVYYTYIHSVRSLIQNRTTYCSLLSLCSHSLAKNRKEVKSEEEIWTQKEKEVEAVEWEQSTNKKKKKK